MPIKKKVSESKVQKFPSDFKPKGSTPEKIAEFNLGHMGKMVGGSKSIYRHDNPKNVVVFNANICTKKNGKIWHGDIDLTVSYQELKDLAIDLKQDVFILREMDARFENAEKPKLENAVSVISPEGKISFREESVHYLEKGVPYTLTHEEYAAKFPSPPREPEIFAESDYEAIELPPLSSFKVTKKTDPLSDFQNYFIEKYGRENAVPIYESLWVSKSYMEGLEALAEQYAKKLYPKLHPAKLDQSIAFYMLDLSPMSFQDDQPWEKPNTGYLKLEKLNKQKKCSPKGCGSCKCGPEEE